MSFVRPDVFTSTCRYCGGAFTGSVRCRGCGASFRTSLQAVKAVPTFEDIATDLFSVTVGAGASATMVSVAALPSTRQGRRLAELARKHLGAD